jgi:hypothetical protein
MARPKRGAGQYNPALAGCSGLGRLLEKCKTARGRASIYGGAKGVSLTGKRLEQCKRKKK